MSGPSRSGPSPRNTGDSQDGEVNERPANIVCCNQRRTPESELEREVLAISQRLEKARLDADIRKQAEEQSGRAEEPVAGPSSSSAHSCSSDDIIGALDLRMISKSDTRLWPSFSSISDDEETLTPTMRALFATMILDNTISRMGYITIVANICMVESGFVPVFDINEPFTLSADEFMLKSVPERNNWCIDVLLSIFRARRGGHIVYYKYINKVEHNDPSRFHYKFDKAILKFTVWNNIYTFISLKGKDVYIEFRLDNIERRYIYSLTNWQRLQLPNMMRRFNTSVLCTDVKAKICYRFIDIFGYDSSDMTGFNMLPTEIIEYFAQLLDLRSFLRLSQTSIRVHLILQNAELWRVLCMRIPIDFPAYNLPVPDMASVRASMNLPGSSYKEIYKSYFDSAKASRRESRRPFWFPPFRPDNRF